MKVAVVSEDFHALCGPAGKARRFLLFEAPAGKRPRLESYFQLPAHQPSYHDLHEDDHTPHPVDGMALIAAEAGEGFRERLARRGVDVHITSERDPHTAVQLLVEGKLPEKAPSAPTVGVQLNGGQCRPSSTRSMQQKAFSMSDSPAGSIKSRWHSYKAGHFLNLHGVVKGTAGAGTALLMELSDDNEVIQALEKSLEDLEYEVIDININIAFKPGTEIPEEPLGTAAGRSR